MDSFSISNTLSKDSIYESNSILLAYQDDAASRLAEGVRPEAISNEKIRKGDLLIETYRVEENAIHGGMGSVWRVFHTGWNTDLAMKRPQPRFFAEGSERRKEEFIAECEHWIDLGLHSNIVSCYYVRDIGGVPTIFSEWMDGGSLKDAIESGRLYAGPEDTVRARLLDIAIQAARGLRYSHGKGLVHQDVKPGNILLTGDWAAKVGDFGLARARTRLNDGEKQVSGGYTPAYCPKEQAEGAAPETWMDVFAWALTVMEMYAGKRLWQTGAEAAGMFRNGVLPAETFRIRLPEGLAEQLQRCLSGQADGFDELEDLLIRCYRGMTGRPYPRPDLNGEEEAAAAMNNRALSFLDLGRQQDALTMLENSRTTFSFYNRTLLRRRMGENTEEAEKRLKSKEKCLINLENGDIRNAWTEMTEPVFDAHLDHMLTDSDLGHTYEVVKSRLTQPPEPIIREFKGTAGYLFDGKLLLGISSDQAPGKLPPENPESMQLKLIDPETGRTLRDFAPPPLYPYGRPFSHVGKVCMSRGGKYAFAVNMNMQPRLQGRTFSTPMERERFIASNPCGESSVWNRAMGVHVWDGRTGEYLKYMGVGAVGHDGLPGLRADPEDEETVRVGDHEWNVQTGEHRTVRHGRTHSAEYELPGGYTVTVTEQGDAEEAEIRRNGETVSRYGGGQISVDAGRGIIMDSPYSVSHQKYRSLANYVHQVTLLSVREFAFRAPMVLEKIHTTDELIEAYEAMQRAEENARKAGELLDRGSFKAALQEYERARYCCYSNGLWSKPLGRMCMELGWRFAGRADPTFAAAVDARRVDSPFKNYISLAYDTETADGDSAYTLISDPRCREQVPVMPVDMPYTPAAFRLSVRSLSTGQMREVALPKGVIHAAILADGNLYCLAESVEMREVTGPANRIYNWCTISNKIPILQEAWADSGGPDGLPGSEIRHVQWPMVWDISLYRVSLKDGSTERIGPGAGRTDSIQIGKNARFTAGLKRSGSGAPECILSGSGRFGRHFDRDEVLAVSKDARLLVCGNFCDPGELFLLNCYWKDPGNEPAPEAVQEPDRRSGYELNVRNLGMNQMTVIEPKEPAKRELKREAPKAEPGRVTPKAEQKKEPAKPAPEPAKGTEKKGLFSRLFGQKKGR